MNTRVFLDISKLEKFVTLKVMKNFFFLVLMFLLMMGSSGQVLAQSIDLGVAIPVTVTEGEVPLGSVICNAGDEYVLCNQEFQVEMFGVVVASPAAAIVATNIPNSFSVITSGRAVVRVNASRGAIVQGDLVTSSTTPGIGVKAVKNGFVLGTALEGWESGDPNQVGQIEVSIKVHPSLNLQSIGENLFETLREGLSVPFLDPLSALRYLAAAVIVVVSFVVGFIYFGRVAKAGVEAIGRNPLAGARIQMAVVVQVLLTLGVGAIGLGLAYLILVL